MGKQYKDPFITGINPQKDTNPVATNGKSGNPILDAPAPTNLGGFGVNTDVANFDISKYEDYYTPGSYIDPATADNHRANQQSGWAQARNALGKFIPNTLLSIVEQNGYIYDFEDYSNKDLEVGNFLSNWARELKGDINEFAPIHRTNPGESFDITDSGWWFENGSSLAESATAFVATTFLTRGATLGALGRANNAMKWLGSLGFSQKTLNVASTGLSTLALNQAESAGIGVDVFNTKYEEVINALNSDPNNTQTDEEKDLSAKSIAAESASSAINFNRANILLNLTSVGSALKYSGGTRNLLRNPTLKNKAKGILTEGLQEYAEETINYLGEKQALDDNYTFAKGVEDAFSAEGFESGVLGFAGGVGQTGLISAGNSIPMRKDKNGNYTSANAQERERFYEQQKHLASIESLNSSQKIGDATSAYLTTKEVLRLNSEIAKAHSEGDTNKVKELADKLITAQAYHAFQTGTTEKLIEVFNNVANLTEEEAEGRGLDVATYKDKSNETIEFITSLEKEYVKSVEFINSNQIFENRANVLSSEKLIKDIEKENAELRKEANDDIRREGIDLSSISEDSLTGKLYVDLESLTDEDGVVPDTSIESIPSVMQYNANAETIDKYKQFNKKLAEEYKTQTSREYQTSLVEELEKERKLRVENAKKLQAKQKLEAKRQKLNNDINNTQSTKNKKGTNTVAEQDVENSTKSDETTQTEKEELPDSIEDGEGDSSTIKPIESTTVNGKIKTNNPSLDSAINNRMEDPNLSLEDKLNGLTKLLNDVNSNDKFDEESKRQLNLQLPKLIDEINNLIESNKTSTADAESTLTKADELADALATLIEEDLSVTVEETNNDKNRAKVSALFDLLDTLEDSGIDTNDFVAVAKFMNTSLGSPRFSNIYESFRRLYNALDESRDEVFYSYNDIFTSLEDRAGVKEQYDAIINNTHPDGTYTIMQQKLGEDYAEAVENLRKLENSSPKPMFSPDLHRRVIVGFNKLAYLAKNFHKRIVVDSSGRIRIEKSEIDNNLRNIPIELLDPSMIKEGDTITMIPLESQTLEDGTIIYSDGRIISKDGIETKGNPVEMAPIGVMVNGKLIDGLFIHDVNWINKTNVVGDIVKDKADLIDLRTKILANPLTGISAKISSKSIGSLIYDAEGKNSSVTENLPEAKILISKNGLFYNGIGSTSTVANKVKPKDNGAIYVELDIDGVKFAHKVNRNTLNDSQVHSVINAVRLFYTADKNDPTVRKIDSEYGINILTSKGLSDYVNSFVMVSNGVAGNAFKAYANSMPSYMPLITIKGDTVEFSRGQGINYFRLNKKEFDTYSDSQKKATLDEMFIKLNKQLRDSYINIDMANLNNKEFSLPLINNDGTIEAINKPYNEYVKDNTNTNLLSYRLDNGKTIYTIQQVYEFDTSNLIGKEDSSAEEDTREEVSEQTPKDSETTNKIEKRKETLKTLKDSKITFYVGDSMVTGKNGLESSYFNLPGDVQIHIGKEAPKIQYSKRTGKYYIVYGISGGGYTTSKGSTRGSSTGFVMTLDTKQQARDVFNSFVRVADTIFAEETVNEKKGENNGRFNVENLFNNSEQIIENYKDLYIENELEQIAKLEKETKPTETQAQPSSNTTTVTNSKLGKNLEIDLDDDFSPRVDGGNISGNEDMSPKVDITASWSNLKNQLVYTEQGVNTMRTSNKEADYAHFGNPFSEGGYSGTKRTKDVSTAIQAYKDWLKDDYIIYEDNHGVVQEIEEGYKKEQRQWILEQINLGKLDNATLLYDGKLADRGQGTHAHALAEVVSELREGKGLVKTLPTVHESGYVSYSSPKVLSDATIQAINDSAPAQVLIKEIQLESQLAIIDNIASDIFHRVIQTGSASESQIKSEWIILLNAIKDKYTDANKLDGADKVQKIIDSFDILFEQAKNKLSKNPNLNVSMVETEDDNTNDLESDSEKNNWSDEAVFKLDTKNSVTKELKNYLEGISDTVEGYDTIGEVVQPKTKKAIFGLDVKLPFDTIFNDLQSILASDGNTIMTADFDSMIAEIELHIAEKPYLYYVINNTYDKEGKLQRTGLKYATEEIKAQFVSTMSKHYSNHTYLFTVYDRATNTYKLIPVKSDSSSLTSTVLQDWNNKLRTAKYIGNKSTNSEQLYVLNQDDIRRRYDNIITDLNAAYDIKVALQSLLSDMGINIPIEVLQKFEQGIYYEDNFVQLSNLILDSNGIFKLLIDNFTNRGESTIIEKNPLGHGSTVILAKYVSRFIKGLHSNSGKDVNGSQYYWYSQNKFFVDRLGRLKSDDDLIRMLSEQSFTTLDENITNSYWLRDLALRDENGKVVGINKNSAFYRELNYFTVDGARYFGDSGKKISDMSDAEYEGFRLGMFMNKGASISSQGATTEGKVKGRSRPIINLFHPTTSDKSTVMGLKVLGWFTNLDVDGNLGKGEIDALFNALVRPEIARIAEEQRAVEKTNISGFDKGFNKFYFIPELNDFKAIWIEDGVLDDTILNDKTIVDQIKERYVKPYIQRMIAEQIEDWKDLGIITTKEDGTEVLSYIDNTFSKNYGEDIKGTASNFVFNYVLANSEMFKLFIGDPALYAKGDVENTFNNIGKRLASHIAPGIDLAGSPNESFRVAYIADRTGGIDEAILSNYEKLLSKESYNEYKNNLKGTDAQEYTTLTEHLNIMRTLGEINSIQLSRFLYMNKNNIEFGESDLDIILRPMKPVYVNNVWVNGKEKKVYIKSSSIPLFKQLTKGLEIDKLRIAMEKEGGVDRVVYSTAVKVGNVSNPLQIYNKDGSIKDDITFADAKYVEELPRQGMKIQQQIPYDATKSKSNDGSQKRKLITVNILDVGGFVDSSSEDSLTGKQIQDELNKNYNGLYKSGYDKLVKELLDARGKIDIPKLQKILKEEAIKRDYPLNDIESLEVEKLSNGTYRFKSPIWASTVSTKMENLLNSIVDNRVRKLKVRGNSYVLVSEEGFKAKDIMEVDDATKMINTLGIHVDSKWLKESGGKLRPMRIENGEVQPDEVFVPFEFFSKSGKLLTMEKYLTKDGFIDMSKIDDELLNMFGYRIPTQGLNSMSKIRIVGFLPKGFKASLVAPRDFTIRMGSDFDVDKLYVHSYNTKLKGGRIVKDSKEGTSNYYENRILDLHLSVLSNPDERVFKQVIEPLGFGKLKDIANRFESIRAEQRGSFSGLSPIYQRQKFLQGRAGKSGVGVFSMDSVFNALVQGKGIHLLEKVLVQGKVVETLAVIKFGNLTSNNLSDVNTIGGKYKSDIISYYQSAAVDNENEQLLDKLNINSFTFDTIRVLNQMGFEEEVVLNFINQPIILEYVKQMSKVGDNIVDLKRSDVDELIEKSFPISEKDGDTSQYADPSVEDMLDMITNIESTELYNLKQTAILDKFKQLTQLGKNIQTVQSTINSDSKGVGKDLLYTIQKVEQIKGLFDNSNLRNAHRLIGEYFVPTEEYEDWNTMEMEDKKEIVNTLLAEGYILVDNILIKPTTINGFASVYATAFSGNIYSDLFPYKAKRLRAVFQQIKDFIGVERGSIEQNAENDRQIWNSVKSYLYSGNMDTLTNGDVESERQRLLIDTMSNKSLATILQELRDADILTDNPFLSRIGISIHNVLPSNTFFDANSAIGLDESYIYAGFLDLINKETPLGTFNGIEYTSRTLAQDLVTSQFLNGGIQRSSEFIRYIPSSYLNSLGFFDNFNEINLNSQNTLPRDGGGLFAVTRQYIQHNPRKVAQYGLKGIKFSNGTKQFSISDKDAFRDSYNDAKGGNLDILSRKFVAFYDSERESGFRLYEAFTDGIYREIDILGYNDKGKGIISEYNMEKGNAKTVIIPNMSNTAINNDVALPKTINEIKEFLKVEFESIYDSNSPKIPLEVKPISEEYGLTDTFVTAREKTGKILSKIVDKDLSPFTSYLSSELLSVLDNLPSVSINLDYNLNARGMLRSINGIPNSIAINTDNIRSESEFESVFLEELIHAITKEAIRENKNGEVLKLNALLAEVQAKVAEEFGEDFLDKVREKVKNRKSLNAKEMIAYRTINLEEFIAGALFDSNFQKYLNSKMYREDSSSLWNKFKGIVIDILASIGVVKNSYLDEALSNVLSLLDSTSATNFENSLISKVVRTPDYVNNKLGLTDTNGNPVQINNAIEVSRFIKNNISNLNVRVDNGYYVVISNKVLEIRNPLEKNEEIAKERVITEVGDVVTVYISPNESYDGKVLSIKEASNGKITLAIQNSIDESITSYTVDSGGYDSENDILIDISVEGQSPVNLNDGDTSTAPITPIELPKTFEEAQVRDLTPEPGRYVTYQGNTFIITKINANGTFQIYDPIENTKKSVAGRNIVVLNDKADFVTYKGAEYMVTPKDSIISLTTNKIMNWKANDGNRVEILQLRNEQEDLSPVVDEGLYDDAKIFGTDEDYETHFPMLVRSRNFRIKLLENYMNIAESNKDYARYNSLQYAKGVLEQQLIDLADVNVIEDIIPIALQDLEELDNMFKREMNESDIVYARKIINLWKSGIDLFFDEDSKTSEKLLKLFSDIRLKAEGYHDKLADLAVNSIERRIKEGFDEDIDLVSYLQDSSDISAAESWVLDIARSGNVVLDVIAKTYKKARFDAKRKADKVNTEIDELLHKIKPILNTYKGKSGIYEIFRQKYSDGGYTGNLVRKFTPEYYEDISSLYQEYANNKSEESFDKFRTEKANRSILLDVRKLFPSDLFSTKYSEEEVNAHKQELRDLLGDAVYEETMRKQESLMKLYEEARETNLQIILDKFNLDTEKDLKTNEEARNEFNSWLIRNSPYNYITSYETNAIQKIDGNPVYPQRSNFITEIPRKTHKVTGEDLGYYDANFEVIESNEDLFEFYNYLNNTLETFQKHFPTKIQDLIQFNGFPEIRRTLMEDFNEKGSKLALTNLWDNIRESVRTDDISEVTYADIDPVTKTIDRSPIVSIFKDRQLEYRQYIQRKAIEYVQEHNEEPSIDLKRKWKREIVGILAEKKSYDLGKVLKIYATAALTQQHKNQITDILNVAQSVLNEAEEFERTPTGDIRTTEDGTLVSRTKEDSFKNTKKQLEYFLDSYFGSGRPLEGVTKTRIFNLDEKKNIDNINELLKVNQKRYDNNEIEYEEYERHKKTLEEQLETIGGNAVWSKRADNILKFVQLKVMGWNVLSSISNMGFGIMDNLMEAADGRVITQRDLFKGYRAVLGSVGRNLSFNSMHFGESKKIASMMSVLDVLNDSANEINENTTSQWGKAFKFASPYNPNTRTEYINQAPLLYAVFNNTIVKDASGNDRPLWEAFDEDGAWKKGEFGEENTDIIFNSSLKVGQLIRRTHGGGYDPDLPLMAKKFVLGRALTMFRSWMFEKFASRIQGSKNDRFLGIETKGRYLSYGSAFNTLGASGFAVDIVTNLLRKLAFKNTNWDSKLSEVDAANMRKNLQELVILANLSMFIVVLKAIAEGLGDDEEDRFLFNHIINQSTRLQSDLTFYVSPEGFKQLLKDPIPAASILTDFTRITEASFRFVIGDDIIGSGENAGDSRLGNSVLKALPITTQFMRVTNTGKQLLDKDYSIVDEIIKDEE